MTAIQLHHPRNHTFLALNPFHAGKNSTNSTNKCNGFVGLR
jgi:hypothetical protein